MALFAAVMAPSCRPSSGGSINDTYMYMTERLLDQPEPSQGLHGDRGDPAPTHLHLQGPLVVDCLDHPLHLSPWQELRPDPRAAGAASGPGGSEQRLAPSGGRGFPCLRDALEPLQRDTRPADVSP